MCKKQKLVVSGQDTIGITIHTYKDNALTFNIQSSPHLTVSLSTTTTYTEVTQRSLKDSE